MSNGRFIVVALGLFLLVALCVKGGAAPTPPDDDDDTCNK